MSLLPRDASLTLADRRRIDEICLAYEDEWLAGRRPVVEAFLRQAGAAQRAVLLRELLLLELDYRRSIHETPRSEDYLARFPECSAAVHAAFQVTFSRAASVRHLPGSRIGRYEVRRLLGAGAFAAVYLAWDEQLRREVAVKVPQPSRLSEAGQRLRFVAEARTVARLKHPGIVPLYDATELEDGTVYLVMQYVAGQSLRQRLDDGRMSPDEACELLAEVADAIDAAHRTGVIHRDLKPSNILLDEQGRPHVCDFGLALEESQQVERKGEYAGTLAYMSPEQLRGESHQLDGRADIWALGVVLYELLTGRQPFQGRDRQELTEDILTRDPRPPRQIDTRVGRAVERICLRCLEKRPPLRYSTAADVAEDLRRVRDGCSRRLWLRLGLALPLLALTLLGMAATRWRSPERAVDALRVPWQGSLEVTVWNPRQPLRQGMRIDDAGVLPLCSGDRVRLTVELSRPAYVYVVWLDTRGVPAPVYPWRHGNWQTWPDVCDPVAYLALPESPDAGWEMRNPHSGMETVLLLVRRSPLPRTVDLCSLLKAVPNALVACRPTVLRFREGRPLPSTLSGTTDALRDANRDPIFASPVTIDDPLLKLQRALATRLRPHFELIQAVTFPVRGD